MRMYDYTEAMVTLENMLLSGDIELETYQDTLKSIEGGANEKAENLGKMIDNFKAHAEALKMEENRLKAKRKTIDNRIEWLTNSLEMYLKSLGKEEHQVGLYTLGYRNLPDIVEISDESKLPEAYLVPQKPKPDKVGLKKVLKDGETVPGATLAKNRIKFEVKK